MRRKGAREGASALYRRSCVMLWYGFRSELLLVERSVTVFLSLDFSNRESEALW